MNLDLIITFVIGFVIVLWYRRLRYVRGLFRPTAGVLRDRHGLAQLNLPASWKPGQALNKDAGLEGIDPLWSRHVIVISEPKEDFEPEMTLAEHSRRTRASLAEGVKLLETRGPDHTTVAGFEAIQFELDAVVDLTRIRYLHTTVLGRRAFHQILAWSTQSRYKREVFDTLLRGFTEIEGPVPHGPHPPVGERPSAPVKSDYDVH